MHQKKFELEAMLADGYTRRFALETLKALEEEKSNPCFDQNYVAWAHDHGFTAESAYAYGLSEDNLGDYLSDYENNRLWPLNSWSRIWVNDKLTLKLMLADEEFKGIMPDYYYYAAGSPSGVMLKTLADAKVRGGNQEENFLALLRELGEFACKPNNGQRAVGFVKLSYADGSYYINEDAATEAEILAFVRSNPNMLYTEYLRPSEEFARFSPLIHTLRVVFANPTGDDPVMIHGYFRLPNATCGSVNYTILDGSNDDKFNIFLGINPETGEFGDAKLMYTSKVAAADIHPDTGELMHGFIPDWEQLMTTLKGIARKFSNLEYIGFDLGITTGGPKCMEINTNPGVKYSQVFTPLMRTEPAASYFREKIRQLDALTPEQKAARNTIRN